MAPSRRRAAAATVVLAVVGSLLAASSAFGADQRVVKARDDCDPVTFTLAGVPCVGDGRTPIGDLVAGAQAGDPSPRWRFSRPDFNIDAGGTIHFVNEGGEAHTFTMVQAFGDGCVPVVNVGGVVGTPAADCATIVPIPAGGTMDVTVPTTGTVLFQCMIHPWMRSIVDVRGGGHGGED